MVKIEVKSRYPLPLPRPRRRLIKVKKELMRTTGRPVLTNWGGN